MIPHVIRSFQKDKIPFPLGYEDFDLIALMKSSKCQKLSLEIGAGAGWHAIDFALKNPQTLLIAIEHSKERFVKLQRRWEKHSKPLNLIPVHADAESFVSHCLPNHSLDEVILLYPNPYPKVSQSNKRWHNMPFWAELLRKMKLNSELQFATNEKFYSDEFVATMQKEWKCQVLTEILIYKNKDFIPRTHFEKKYFERGETLYLSKFRVNLD